jgi:hypothetical protein
MKFANFYYHIKPLIPRYVQVQLRRFVVQKKYRQCSRFWPIDEKSGQKPTNWRGWPNNRRFALVLTHDVDTERGQKRCYQLSQIEENLGFRSSFNFVPERYDVSNHLRNYLEKRGFEIGVHGLVHDGKLYASKKIFEKRAKRINEYIDKWDAVGFRSPAMQHNLEWIKQLKIQYDASTFDTDPFEPQPHGVGTIFPFWIEQKLSQNGYVELPYTLPQDFTLFILMKEKTIQIWKTKLEWIAEKGGMALLNVHPDYLNFDGKKKFDEYPARYYEDFLKHINQKYRDQIWHALPRDIAAFLRQDKTNHQSVKKRTVA